ncbi:MAG: TonB-dependent receptor [Elusimicrobiota bacterium]
MSTLKYFLIFFSCAHLIAGEYYDGTMDEIVVYESSIKEAEKSNFSTKAIEKGKNIYLPDILKNEPEVDLRRRAVVSDNGDMLSIRGLSSNRLLLNLNGRSLNAAGVVGGHYIDWSTLPLDNIDKIQLIKGGSDVKYGNNALGGVINIKTKEPEEKMHYGFFGSYSLAKDIDYIQNYRVYNSFKKGLFGYSVSGSYSKSDEFFWNNDYEAKNIGGTFFLDMPYDGKLEIGTQYTKIKRGFIINNRKSNNPSNPLFYSKYNEDYPLAFGDFIAPGTGNQNIFKPAPGSFWDKEKTYLDLGYKQPLGDLFSEFKIYKNIENRFEKNYSSSLIKPGYPDGLLVLNRKVESDRSWGTSFSISGEKNKNSWEIGAEYKYLGYGDINVYWYDKTYNNNFTYTGGPASQEGKIWAYYAKDRISFSDKLSAHVGIRYDDYKVDPLNGSIVKKLNDTAISLSVGLSCKISERDNISFNAYIKSRTPGMPEVYWWSNGITGGTNNLKSERNHAVEISASHRFFDKDFLTISAYNYNIDDYIMFRFDINAGSGRGVYNIDNVRIYGASIDYRGKKGDTLDYYANLTLQKSKKGYDMYDNGVLDGLDYMPKVKSNVGTKYSFTPNSSLEASWKFVDNQNVVYSYYVYPTYNYKKVTLSAYSTFALEYKLKYNEALEFSAYCENIFNESYSEKYGYPMTGRIAGITVKAYF